MSTDPMSSGATGAVRGASLGSAAQVGSSGEGFDVGRLAARGESGNTAEQQRIDAVQSIQSGQASPPFWTNPFDTFARLRTEGSAVVEQLRSGRLDAIEGAARLFELQEKLHAAGLHAELVVKLVEQSVASAKTLLQTQG